MKDIQDIQTPDNLRYTDAHEWLAADTSPSRMGITDYAQDQIGRASCRERV